MSYERVRVLAEVCVRVGVGFKEGGGGEEHVHEEDREVFNRAKRSATCAPNEDDDARRGQRTCRCASSG